MKKVIVLLLFVLLCTSSSALAETVVIINSGVSDAGIDGVVVEKIYLGKKSKWDDGNKINAVGLNDGDVHRNFLDKYIRKSASQYSTYWKQMIFTGKGVPPKTYSSETELVDYVSKTSGAIGYIDSTTPHDGVKVVK